MTAARTARQVAAHFDDANQQRHAAHLGMFVFLASELLVFAVLLTGYAAARWWYPDAFHAAGQHLYKWIGVGNTAILLLSSAAMAAAVQTPVESHRARSGWMLATALLGTGFLIVKGIEYALDIQEGLLPGFGFDAARFEQPGPATLFVVFYWAITGLHAFHVGAGVIAIAVVAALTRRGPGASIASSTIAHNVGLYWHFVDIVWLVILPLLYLNP